MKDQVIKGALIGFAVRGLTVSVIAINKTALQTLWRFNCMAAEMVWTISLLALEWVEREETKTG